MPFYDRICPNDHRQIDVFEPVNHPAPACVECGDPTVRAWFGKVSGVLDDSIPGGYVMEHVEPGRKVYSKSELRAVLASHGYEQHVTHVTPPGSDRSKHTTRWI